MEEAITVKEATAWRGERKRPGSPAPAWEDGDFEQVFRQHYTRIVGVLRRVVGDAGQAEELADELFWKLYRQPPADRGRLGGWLYRGAVQDGIDALRASRRRRQYEAASFPPAPPAGADPERELLRREQRQRVHQVLATLKPAQAQLLMLRQCGLSYRELADVMELQAGSIGTLLARAEDTFEKAWRQLEEAQKGGRG